MAGSMSLAFMGFDLWFQSEAHRAEAEVQLYWPNADDTIWSVAPAKEQLALVADYELHGISFRYGLMVGGRRRTTFREANINHLEN